MKEKLFNELENYLILIKEKAHQKSLKNLDHSIELLEIDLINFKRRLNNNSWQISYNDFFNKIPEEIKIYSSADLNYFFNTQSNLSEKNYNLKNSLLHIYNENIIFNLDKISENLKKWAFQELESIISSFKLVSFTHSNRNEDILSDSKKKLIHNIELFNQNLILKKERLVSKLGDLKIKVDKLNDYSFLSLNESKKYVSLDQDANSFWNFENLQNYFSEKFISLLDLLSVEKIQEYQPSKNDQLNLLRDFIEYRIPSKKNLKQIPKLYLQLFSNDTKPNSFFSSFISNQEKIF